MHQLAVEQNRLQPFFIHVLDFNKDILIVPLEKANGSLKVYGCHFFVPRVARPASSYRPAQHF
jgi:hypothetical protein